MQARLRTHRSRLAPQLVPAFDALLARRGFLDDDPAAFFHPLGQPIATFPLWIADAVGGRRLPTVQPHREHPAHPAADADFTALYRRRNDAGSINRALDDTLWLRPAHSIGHARQHLNVLTFALGVNSLPSTDITAHRSAKPPEPQSLWAARSVARQAAEIAAGGQPRTTSGAPIERFAALPLLSRPVPATELGVSSTFRAGPAPVAQGIERRFPKPCVAGSNPAGGTAVPARWHAAGRRVPIRGGLRNAPTAKGRVSRWR